MISRETTCCNAFYFKGTAQQFLILTIFLFLGVKVWAQDAKLLKQKEEAAEKSLDLTFQANQNLTQNQDDIQAEMAYRRAISKNDSNSVAKYNLGNLYYRNNSLGEAFMRYKQAGLTAESKADKHKAYHNLGNVFMKNKEYPKAVEAYKEALRNDPTDDQTRYNLALAKEENKKQQQQNKDNQDKKDDKDQKDQNKDNKEDQNQDQKNNKENKDNKQGEDKKDQQGEDKKDDKKEGEDQKQPQDNKPDQGEKNQEPKPEDNQQQPRPNQLSPQQIKNILEAMNNEEQKVRERINAEKVKGKPVQNEKDW